MTKTITPLLRNGSNTARRDIRCGEVDRKAPAGKSPAELVPVLNYIHARESGVSIREAARLVAVADTTIWRRAKRLLEHGLAGILPGRQRSDRLQTAALDFAGSRADAIARKRLRHVLKYMLACYEGVPPPEAAASLPIPQLTLRNLVRGILRYGLDGIAPDRNARLRARAELAAFEITDEIVDEVERLAAKRGSVQRGWKEFGRSWRRCPFRLSVRIGKKEPLPRSFIKAIALQPVQARAWRGRTGRIYVHVAGKQTTIEKPNRARAIYKN